MFNNRCYILAFLFYKINKKTKKTYQDDKSFLVGILGLAPQLVGQLRDFLTILS